MKWRGNACARVAVTAAVVWAAAVPSVVRAASSSGVTVTVQARALKPGEVVLVTARTNAPARSVTGQAGAGHLRFSRTDDPLVWLALLGLDVRVTPGQIRLAVRAVDAEGTSETVETLTVLPRRPDQRRITVDPRFAHPPASELARIEREAKLMADVLGVVSPERLWRGPFVAPVPGRPTSAFGRVSIVNGERRAPHAGVDLQAADGTPVCAPAAGRVVLSASLYYAGDTVIIDHGLGVFSLLAHLSERRTQPGTLVGAGDVVGLSGSTGRITGPHLHWGTRIGPALVDPLSLIAATSGVDREGKTPSPIPPAPSESDGGRVRQHEVEAELRPGLHRVTSRPQVVERQESQVRDARLAARHVFVAEFADMDDAEVDLADRCRIVIDERDDPGREIGVDEQFFVQFPLDGVFVEIEARPEQVFVAVVDVAADADRALGDEAFLAGGLAAHVVQQRVAAADEHVRDQLLERRVVFGERSRDVPCMLRLEHARHVRANVGAEPLEGANLVEERARERQNQFVGHGSFYPADRVAERSP